MILFYTTVLITKKNYYFLVYKVNFRVALKIFYEVDGRIPQSQYSLISNSNKQPKSCFVLHETPVQRPLFFSLFFFVKITFSETYPFLFHVSELPASNRSSLPRTTFSKTVPFIFHVSEPCTNHHLSVSPLLLFFFFFSSHLKRGFRTATFPTVGPEQPEVLRQ